MLAVGEDWRWDQGRDRPHENLTENGQPEHPVGLDRFPAQPHRGFQAPFGPGGRDLWDQDSRRQPARRQDRQNQAPDPGVGSERIGDRVHARSAGHGECAQWPLGSDDAHDQPPRHDARDDCQIRDHFEQAIAGGEPLVGENLRQDPVLGRDEDRRLQPQQAKHSERQPPGARLNPERDRAGQDQHQLDDLHRHDDRPLADAVGDDAPWQRKQEEREHEDDLHHRRLLLFRGLSDHDGDQEQGDDLLPGLVVELPECLRNQQAPQTALPGRGRSGCRGKIGVPVGHFE